MSAEDARKLFVGGLAETVGEPELRAFFGAADFVVEHVAVPRDRETGRPRGFAFVTLSSEAEALRATQQLNNAPCGGRPLRIRPFSQETPKRGPGEERPRRTGPDASLFLGKLPYDVTPDEITTAFAGRGVVVQRVTLPQGPDGRARGFGFASVESEAAAEEAVLKLADLSLKGRLIVVSRAQAKGAGGAPGGGGGPGGGGPRFEDRGGPGGAPGGPPRWRPSPGASEAPPSGGAPPTEGEGEGDRGGLRDKRPRKVDKVAKRSNLAPQRGQRRERGGGGSWQKWDDEDE
jgi:nucleolin